MSSPSRCACVTGNVGGSFGMKAAPYPEYVCVLHAARALGRPVKWTDERSGSFVSDSHGRDHRVDAELALDADGNFLAVRLTSFGNMGGFLANVGPMPSTQNAVKNVQSVYRTPLIEVSTKCVFTNTTHVSAYRGAGRPEGNYYMERLIDTAAAEMEIDRLELRRRNHIRPREMPFKAAIGRQLRQRRFPAVMKKAIEAADTKGFRQRKRESRKRGKLRGLGIGSYLEVTAPPSKEMGGIVFEADGGVTILTGTLDFGMGHASPFAQVLHEKLGVPFDKIRLMQTDSDRLVDRRRLRRLEIAHAHRHGVGRSRRQSDRPGQADRLACAGSVRRRHRVQEWPLCHRRHRPRDRHHGAGRKSCAPASICRRACRPRSTSTM